MIRREGELRVIVRRQGEVTRREGELRVIVRRQGEIDKDVAKSTDMRLAWKIEVSTVILPAKN